MRELLRISAEMKRSRPVFIVGEARSGTSILYRTLQKHPSFRPLRPNLVETEIFAQLRRTFLFRPGYPPTLVRFMLEDEGEYKRFLASVRVPRAVSALVSPVNLAVRDRSDALWAMNLSALVVRAYFFHAARARGVRRLVEKTPTNTRNLPKLAACFPRARLLYVHRHPVDVFASYRRRVLADPDAGWAVLDVGPFCDAWGRSTARALRWAASHDDLHLVSYERFTSAPEVAFADVCRFLGEPVEPEAVREPRPDVGRWRGDPHLWGEIVPTTKDWRDFVTATEMSELQERLAPPMRALGYAPYDPAEARGRS
jgi:Sulfotransferase family